VAYSHTSDGRAPSCVKLRIKVGVLRATGLVIVSLGVIWTGVWGGWTIARHGGLSIRTGQRGLGGLCFEVTAEHFNDEGSYNLGATGR
jgi:hypothetical protein